MEVSFCLDTERLFQKPKKMYIASIGNRIASKQVSMKIEEAAKCIAKGYSFTPAVFNGNPERKKENVQAMQFFALDFDHAENYEFDYHYIKKRFDELEIPIAFSYHTLSSKPEYPKFRVVLYHIVPITEHWLMNLIIILLIKLFPESDPSCSDISRLFLGGKELIECYSEGVFRIDNLIDSFQKYEYIHNAHNYTSIIREIARKTGLSVNHKRYLDVRTYTFDSCDSIPNEPFFKENRSKINIYILILDQNSLKTTYIVFNKSQTPVVFLNNEDHKNNTNAIKQLRHINSQLLTNMCALINAFSTNEFDLTHEEHKSSPKFGVNCLRYNIIPCVIILPLHGSGSAVKGAYLPVEIFARSLGENTTACPLTE